MEYKAIFLDENLNELGNKKFEPTDEFITFKKGTFNIRLDAYLYKTKDVTYYGYIYPTDEKLLLDVDIKIEPIKDMSKELKGKFNSCGRIVKLKEKLEHGDLKLIVGESIIGQLARMAVMGLKTNWVLILVVAVAVGVGAGGGSYSFGYNNGISQAQHIINSTLGNPNVNVIPTSTPILIHP